MSLSATQIATRKQLRQQLCQQRRELTRSQQNHAAWRLARHLKQSPLVTKAKRIGLYLPHRGEIDAWQFRRLWQGNKNRNNKRLYLPVLPPDGSRRLDFLEASAPWSRNRFGIIEPAYRDAKRLPTHQLDLLLIPLVSFDSQGNRLGMGGGYYDTTLAQLPSWSPRPVCLGVAYRFQQQDALPSAEWDWPLDAVITD